jgi:hypothetical protein
MSAPHVPSGPWSVSTGHYNRASSLSGPGGYAYGTAATQLVVRSITTPGNYDCTPAR